MRIAYQEIGSVFRMRRHYPSFCWPLLMSHNYCRREKDGSGGGGRRPTPNGDLEALQVCPGETAGRGQPAATRLDLG